MLKKGQQVHTEVTYAAAAAAKSRQSCPTLCDPVDDSSTGSSVPGIHQARILEWVAISFSSHNLGGLKKEKFIVSQFWKLNVWNEDVDRVVLSVKPEQDALMVSS